MATIATTGQRNRVTSQSLGLRPVMILMGLSILINYIDRANFSIIAPLLKDELNISAAQLGFLLSAFFWTYALATILSGWLIDRVEASLVLGAVSLWSIATAATSLVHQFGGLFAVRLVFRCRSWRALPAYSKIIAKHIPIQRRGVANASIAAGVALGPAVVVPSGSTTCGAIRVASISFMVLGIVSLVWLFPWFRKMPYGDGIETTEFGQFEHVTDSAAEIGLGHLLDSSAVSIIPIS